MDLTQVKPGDQLILISHKAIRRELYEIVTVDRVTKTQIILKDGQGRFHFNGVSLYQGYKWEPRDTITLMTDELRTRAITQKERRALDNVQFSQLSDALVRQIYEILFDPKETDDIHTDSTSEGAS